MRIKHGAGEGAERYDGVSLNGRGRLAGLKA
jgi:hypothetical protein